LENGNSLFKEIFALQNLASAKAARKFIIIL